MEHSTHDTLYLHQVRQDSVYVYEGSERIHDTLYITRLEYRYRTLHDTVCKIVRDSVPYEVRVVETREVERRAGWFDRLARGCFWIVAAGCLLLAARFLR